MAFSFGGSDQRRRKLSKASWAFIGLKGTLRAAVSGALDIAGFRLRHPFVASIEGLAKLIRILLRGRAAGDVIALHDERSQAHSRRRPASFAFG